MEFLLLLLILAVIQTMQLWYFVIMLFNLKKKTYSFSSFVLYTQTPRKPVFFYIVYKMKVYLPWLGCRFALYKIHTFLSQPCHTFPLQNTHLPLTTMPHTPSSKYTLSSHNPATLPLYKIHTSLSPSCHTPSTKYIPSPHNHATHSLYKIHTFLSQPCHTLLLQITHLPLTTMPHFASTKYTPSSHNHATPSLYKIHTFKCKVIYLQF
jgi:hypothetical protein